MTKIHQSCIMSAPTTSQYAAIVALRGCDDEIEMMRDEYNRRRRYVVKALNEMGLTCFEPRGAFYAYPSVEGTGMTGEQFANELLREEKVAVVPGGAFGEAGSFHVRCSYATSMASLDEATMRIARFVRKRKGGAV